MGDFLVSGPEFPCVVIDNSSRAESEIPVRSARSKRGKCQRPGMWPRLVHINTAFGVNSVKAAATAFGPPNRSTMSSGDVMGTDGDMRDRANQELLVPASWNISLRRGDTPASGRHHNGMGLNGVNKPAWNANVVARLRELLDHMGWSDKTLAEEIHKELGVTKKAVEKYFTSDSIPAFSLFLISERLGISTDYLMLRSDNLKRSINKHGLYARESEREARVRAARGEMQTTPKKAAP